MLLQDCKATLSHMQNAFCPRKGGRNTNDKRTPKIFFRLHDFLSSFVVTPGNNVYHGKVFGSNIVAI